MLWWCIFAQLFTMIVEKYLIRGNIVLRMIMVCKKYELYAADAFCCLLTADSEFIKLFRKSG